jgi:hypothetical protein
MSTMGMKKGTKTAEVLVPSLADPCILTLPRGAGEGGEGVTQRPLTTQTRRR